MDFGRLALRRIEQICLREDYRQNLQTVAEDYRTELFSAHHLV